MHGRLSPMITPLPPGIIYVWFKTYLVASQDATRLRNSQQYRNSPSRKDAVDILVGGIKGLVQINWRLKATVFCSSRTAMDSWILGPIASRQ